MKTLYFKYHMMNLRFIPILFASFLLVTAAKAQQKSPLRLYISVDMEGIGGIGTPKMVTGGGKDYEEGRKLMTNEVNAVVEAIFSYGPAEIVVNDSHGDMQNLLHTKLDPRVEYIQGNIKPLGMVQGLDKSFDGVIFVGYHARAGTESGFLAHTGSGTVKGLWINGREVGEGGLNAHFAGALNVPVILASGDLVFTRQINELINVRTVSTKVAIGTRSAKLNHPAQVITELKEQVHLALKELDKATPLNVKGPFLIRMRLEDIGHADVVMSIPGMKRVDGYTIEFSAATMDSAYRLVRVIYKNLTW